MKEIQISSRDMHLAAYMKVNGAELVAVVNKLFVFKSDITESEWRVKHSNSCCRRIDDELLTLKKML